MKRPSTKLCKPFSLIGISSKIISSWSFSFDLTAFLINYFQPSENLPLVPFSKFFSACFLLAIANERLERVLVESASSFFFFSAFRFGIFSDFSGGGTLNLKRAFSTFSSLSGASGGSITWPSSKLSNFKKSTDSFSALSDDAEKMNKESNEVIFRF